jgi:Uma2 family endonuclease
MSPMPTDQHQKLVSLLGAILEVTVGWPGLGEVRPGVNLSDRKLEWEHNYVVPDVAVFLHGGTAENWETHWRGAADFLIEITSPGDRTREKIPFYSSLGVVELLVIDRNPWTLELYRHQDGQLTKVGQSTLAEPHVVASAVVPLSFQLVPGDPRPQVRVVPPESKRSWLV